jgi:hypothetical protein
MHYESASGVLKRELQAVHVSNYGEVAVRKLEAKLFLLASKGTFIYSVVWKLADDAKQLSTGLGPLLSVVLRYELLRLEMKPQAPPESIWTLYQDALRALSLIALQAIKDSSEKTEIRLCLAMVALEKGLWTDAIALSELSEHELSDYFMSEREGTVAANLLPER